MNGNGTKAVSRAPPTGTNIGNSVKSQDSIASQSTSRLSTTAFMAQFLRSPNITHRTPASFEGKWHQGEVSCPLDRSRELTLMTRTVARDASRNNFAALGHQVTESPHVFVIDQGQFVGTEPTDLFAQKPPAFTRHGFLSRNDGHRLTPPTCLALPGTTAHTQKGISSSSRGGTSRSSP